MGGHDVDEAGLGHADTKAFGRRGHRGAFQDRAAGRDDAVAGPSKILGRGGIGNTDIRGSHKAAAGDNGQGEGLEQIHREIGIGFDHLALRRALANHTGARGEDVEGPLGHAARKSGGLFQLGDDEVPTLPKRACEFLDMSPVAGQRLNGGILRN